MSQFALHPHSSALLCCSTLTDFVLLILKCEMPFMLINILDLVVRGRPCVSCFPYFVSVPKWTLHVLGPFMFVFADWRQYLLHWWHMQSSASCCTSSSWSGDLQYFFPRGEFQYYGLLCLSSLISTSAVMSKCSCAYLLTTAALSSVFLHEKNLVNRPCHLQLLQCEDELLHILAQTQGPNSVQSREPFLWLLPWKI